MWLYDTLPLPGYVAMLSVKDGENPRVFGGNYVFHTRQDLIFSILKNVFN